MAKKTAPRFYEVVFRGKPKTVKAFLRGLIMGAGKKATVFYNYDEGIHHEGTAEKLKEMVGIRATDCHVIVDADTAALIKRKTKAIATETGLEVTANRHVRSASMAFEYHAYARRYDADIQKLFKKLPAGLKLRDHERTEKVDPKARGVEAYTVAHHFEVEGSGTVTGRLDVLVKFRHGLADYPLVSAEEIQLKLA